VGSKVVATDEVRRAKKGKGMIGTSRGEGGRKKWGGNRKKGRKDWTKITLKTFQH